MQICVQSSTCLSQAGAQTASHRAVEECRGLYKDKPSYFCLLLLVYHQLSSHKSVPTHQTTFTKTKPTQPNHHTLQDVGKHDQGGCGSHPVCQRMICVLLRQLDSRLTYCHRTNLATTRASRLVLKPPPIRLQTSRARVVPRPLPVARNK